ncbi:hypothetical protein THAOC_30987, partial [Thalassiosira oceanica]
MSCVPVADDGGEACANCGKQGSDTVKLKNCTACRLVKYCGVDCQRADRKQHKRACKQRAAELKDEQLYSQGHERLEGDFCPICTLPISLLMHERSIFMACCMKRVCKGCDYAPFPDNDVDMLAMIKARVEKKDPVAIDYLAHKYFHGELGLQKDTQKAVELCSEANYVRRLQSLVLIDALYNLGVAYEYGKGVQQDTAKAAGFYTKAAIQGHVS